MFETGHSAGTISPMRLMDESPRSKQRDLSMADLADRSVRGGLPRHLELSSAACSVRDYLDKIRHVDVQRVAGGHRDPERLQRLLQSLARNVAREVAIDVLAADAGEDMDRWPTTRSLTTLMCWNDSW